jgi:hypothetical protein
MDDSKPSIYRMGVRFPVEATASKAADRPE